MALISEWMQQCGKKVLDDAGIVREAIFRQLTIDFAKLSLVSGDCACKSVVISRPLDRVLLGE
jgi:hypothetical protein